MKRYAATFDCFIYAENDEDAKKKANAMAKHMQSVGDNWARPLELADRSETTLTPRKIQL